jgi:hypothetical protein
MNSIAFEHFIFATGIENSYPTIQLPDGSIKRIDEMEKTGHYNTNILLLLQNHRQALLMRQQQIVDRYCFLIRRSVQIAMHHP